MKCEEEDEEQDVEDEEMYECMQRICEWKFVQVKGKSESDCLFICKVTEGKMGSDSSDENISLHIG